jgi:prepilin-type N-terminal cleavage/methylation domain-containing protein
MRKSGFTLIEVVIALVIFMVGALAVVRIFPPAFNVVQNSSYSNVATRLSDSILSRMRGDGSMPDAVFDINDTGSWASNPVEYSWLDQGVAVVGTNDKNGSLPLGAVNDSALDHFKFIRGESHYIQNAAGNDATANAPYLLTNFPYTADAAGGVHLHIDLTITGVSIDQNGRLDFSRATYVNPFTGSTDDFHESGTIISRPLQYILNSGTPTPGSYYAVLLFRSPIGTSFSNTGARFYVSYRYVDGSIHKLNGVVNEPINFPDDSTWNTEGGSGGGLDPSVDTSDCNYVLQGLLKKKLPSADQPVIIAGGVAVTAKAELIFAPRGATGAPPNITFIANGATPPVSLGVDQDDGNRGFVKLPPVVDSSGTSLMPKTQVSADYLVPDWHLLFNQSVSDSSGQVVLPVNLLDSTFSPVGLVAQQNSAANTPAVLVPSTAVDDKKGLVTYGSANASIRTAYKGLDQWASQISPSAESYVPYNNNSSITGFRDPAGSEFYYLPHEQWREYLWASGSSTVYFHANEAGKTVQVSFIPVGSSEPIQQVLTIDENISAPGGVTDYASTGDVATLQLKDNTGAVRTADGILGIRGISVVARTAWLNGKKYEQSAVTGYRTANGG